MTIQKLKAAAKKLNSTVEVFTADGDNISIWVDAPEGKQFRASGATCITGEYWKHAPESKAFCFNDMIERINEGIEDLDHEL